MKTTAIRIEGQIISPEIFDRFDANDIKGQSPKDFGFETGIKIKDEIARAWADAKDQWNIFQRRVENLSEDVSGTSETRKYWIIPFLENLGYNLSISTAEIVNEKSYAISHKAENIDGFKVHIMSFKDSLDKKRESGGPRLSPHALVQDYLNLTEHLYALVTNGKQLRLLRDSGKLIRLTYIEFNIEQMMEDDLYAEFALMYRLIHASRMPQNIETGNESIIEQYHQDSLESGSRIREGLSSAVEQSIDAIANGFLKHPDNNQLREVLRNNLISSEQFYQYMLRFIYRILFLLVIEERDIVYPSLRGKPELQRQKDIYYKYYSISRLRKLADEIFLFDDKLEDLWIALRNTFKIFGDEGLASKLGIYPLAGDLFGYDALGMLSESNLDNHTLLECIRDLCIFENPATHSIIRVNYGALNVEEFGSVYEGLLEKSPQIDDNGILLSFSFIKGTERSSSGSHYTPEELVQPLIKHSLDYVIEEKLANANMSFRTKRSEDPESHELIKNAQAEALLSIKVCDAAAGSGHILLAASRRIALELAKVRTNEDQPSPEPYREAIRDVIGNCIYGVDKNPLAVELCKVALWLEAHNPGLPLNFLDHKIKCGDSIVGLARIEELKNGIATEAFKTLPEDDKEIATIFRNKNKTELNNKDQNLLTDSEDTVKSLSSISLEFKEFGKLPDKTVEDVKTKRELYEELKKNNWWKLKEVADLQVAQFFIPKTDVNKSFITTDADYQRVLAGQKASYERKVANAMAVAVEKRFFHWFLEFPDVFEQGGFDCILGNPPFLGGQKLTGTFGNNFLEWVKFKYAPAGSCDLVTYFFRRIYEIIKPNGFQSLISTNTIAQGGAREGGLDVIRNNNGVINFAIKSMRWPGLAAVEVALVTIHKGNWNKEYYLGNKSVKTISSYLDDSEVVGNPFPLKQNEGKSFQGSIVLGKGFVLEPIEAKKLIEINPQNKDVLFPYLNGEDLNTNPDQSPSRWVINFFDWPLRRAEIGEWDNLTKPEQEKTMKERIIAPPNYLGKVASDYPDCLAIIERDVKPERIENNDRGAREKWWQFLRMRGELYSTISGMERVLVVGQVSKYPNFTFTKTNQVLDAKLAIITLSQSIFFIHLQSSFHQEWIGKYATTLETRLNYTPTVLFQPYPFPRNLSNKIKLELESIGVEYHEFRRQLMLDMQLGLTRTYNLFHNPKCNSNNVEKIKEIREFKSANLQIPIKEAVARIEKLRELHKQMDEAVLKAYGWDKEVIASGTKQSAIDLAHDFYEVDYLPENDRVRYTISPEARKEILKRLLELNHKIHAEEVAAGLWDKKGKAVKKVVSKKKDDETIDLFGG